MAFRVTQVHWELIVNFMEKYPGVAKGRIDGPVVHVMSPPHAIGSTLLEQRNEEADTIISDKKDAIILPSTSNSDINQEKKTERIETDRNNNASSSGSSTKPPAEPCKERNKTDRENKASSSGSSTKPPSDRKEDTNNWSDQETKLLICLYTEHKHKFLSPMYNKKNVWNIISERLKELGTNKSALKCDEKWRNMKKTYDKTWQDMKSNVKKKVAETRRYERGTGGGPPLPEVDKEYDRMKEILDPVAIEGDSNILESMVIEIFNEPDTVNAAEDNREENTVHEVEDELILEEHRNPSSVMKPESMKPYVHIKSF
ncbi:unnamed protein product [Phaedon cochleariae]|uniref:Myb-like domain-containing protein n=1 Tax=Phaedon cochleariae TaxID=80249 RepID=A0A9N9SGA2_PHACE|nr:unnamed protein product [Phaedon cochleariae]